MFLEPLEPRRVLASFMVDTLSDVVDAEDGATSFREAIELANNTAGVDAITFDPNSFASPQTIALTLGELAIRDSVIITGPRANLTIDAGGNSRVLTVTPLAADVTIDHLTITGGRTVSNDEGGGGIQFLSGGTLRLQGASFFNNATLGQRASGGAIFSLGSVIVDESLLIENATMGSDAHGGGIYVQDGSIVVSSSELSLNTTSGRGANGGGIAAESANVTLNQSIVSGNRTVGDESDGGGIYSSNGAVVTISSSIISDNSTTGEDADGGGMRVTGNLTIGETVIRGNRTSGRYAAGGGIASSGGALTLTASSLSGNATAGAFGYGGGILAVRGNVHVVDSTFSGNTTQDIESDGGAIASFFSDVAILGSTVTANSAGGDGGGVSFLDNEDKTLSIQNSIIAGNSDAGVAPDFRAPQVALALTVTSSLIGDNTGTTLGESQTADLNGNLVGAPSPGGGIIDPLLAPLWFNGKVFTHPLMSGSPAINAGDNSLVGTMFDARGEPFARIVNGVVDMGSYERQTIQDSQFIVTTRIDELDFGNSAVSLREAIQVANGNPGFDTITFDPAEFASKNSIDLALGELQISETLTITGPGMQSLTLNAQGSSRVFNILETAGDVTLTGMTITGGITTANNFGDSGRSSDGGGIRFASDGTLSINDAMISENRTEGNGARGGGVFSRSGELIFNRSTVVNNGTKGDNAQGGGIASISGSVALIGSTVSENSTLGFESAGGGIHALSAALVDSTIALNWTSGGRSDGGGLNVVELTVTNSTVSGNQTKNIDTAGGGILTHLSTIASSTIAMNSSAGRSGGIEVTEIATSQLTIMNSIVANNSDLGIAPDLYHPPGSNARLRVASSLIGDNTGTDLAEAQNRDADGNLIGAPSPGGGRIDPSLEPLANNGGHVRTHALQSNSPAINRGNLLLLGAIDHDGRGDPFERIADGAVDLGAYERQSVELRLFVVTTELDELDYSNGDVSLREAINSANGSLGRDIVQFDSSVFRIPKSIRLTLGELELADSVTISGPGSALLSIDAQGISRVFDFSASAGDFSISGLTVTGGSTSDSLGQQPGGGIHFAPANGVLMLSDVNLIGNRSSSSGGGLFSAGETIVRDSEISGNVAAGFGGGIATRNLTITGALLSDNWAMGDNAGGGGLSSSTATIIRTTVENNRATGSDARGGGIDVGLATIVDSIIRNNIADGVGGGIAVESLELAASTVSGNSSGGEGGGIYAATIDPLAITVSGSSISLNVTTGVGADGGGIFLQGGGSISDSTISGNATIGSDADGGGVRAGGVDPFSTLEVVRSTVVQNSATRVGGGVLTSFTGALLVNDSIFAGNSDSGIAPNFRVTQNPANLVVRFSLIDDNTGTTLGESQTTDAFGNLIGRPAPGGAGIIDPMLAPLRVIGPALVHPLMIGSPAINAGDGSPPLPEYDQRGDPFSRIFGGAIDMGAFEFQSPLEPMITWEDPASILDGTVLSRHQLNATVNTPGTFVYTPPIGSVLARGEDQTLSVAFIPDDIEHYLATSTSVTIDVLDPFDYGDAPDSFATRLASDGPRHAASLLRLGDAIDFETDGLPSDRASGDGFDDDGVVVISSLVTDASHPSIASLLVTSSAAGKLDAWIDFNGNHQFDHPDEHIGGGTSIDLSRGDQVIELTVPAAAIPGIALARFRLSTAGGLLPTGSASDGEVEDYELTILDGSNLPVIGVALPRGTATLSYESGELLVVQRQNTLFRAFANSVGRYDMVGTEFSDVLVIDNSKGNPLPASGLAYDGGDRINTLRLIGLDSILDTSSNGNISLRNIDVIDVTDAAAKTVVVDAASVRAMDPTGGGVIVTGGQGDRVVFDDATTWRMSDPIIVAGFIFSKVVTSGTFVQVDFARPWQNLAQPSDVNNDGNVSAGDALRVINELSRRSFSDPDTARLKDPASISTWPNVYFDQNGDGNATALDALRVINELARKANGVAAGEAESVGPAVEPLVRMHDPRVSLDTEPPYMAATIGTEIDFGVAPQQATIAGKMVPIDLPSSVDRLAAASVDSALSDADFLGWLASGQIKTLRECQQSARLTLV